MVENKKILLVEDEPLLGNILKQRLEKENLGVTLARDGEEALNFLKINKPDLILLDIILPKLSGFEVMEKLKEEPSYKKAPIVILSNLGQDSDLEKGQTLGAVGYFVKAQMSIDELVEEVKKLIVQ